MASISPAGFGQEGPPIAKQCSKRRKSLFLRLFARIRTLLTKHNCMPLVSPDPKATDDLRIIGANYALNGAGSGCGASGIRGLDPCP